MGQVRPGVCGPKELMNSRPAPVAVGFQPMSDLLDYILAYVAVGVAILLMFLFWVPMA